MRQRLGTKVAIRYRQGRGQIDIRFFSDDELERVLEIDPEKSFAQAHYEQHCAAKGSFIDARDIAEVAAMALRSSVGCCTDDVPACTR